ncbi:MAG: ABC transporter substrate-binding protein [Propionibacteriales bacterium]|nr:ABC transporter substrate-binding protein [Propionibacteriales bacterium]
MRIVSLLPSATEIVYALGIDDQLVGVTFECNEPERARLEKRIVVGGKDTSDMSPADIDAYVRTQFAAGEDLYTLSEGALTDLDPELILTQDLCRVCAIPTSQVDDALEHLGCAAEVVTLDPYSLDEVLETISVVGRHTGVEVKADEVVQSLRDRLEAVAAAVEGRLKPRVAVIEWVDPLFTGGHWIPDQVSAAGGISVGGYAGQASHAGEWSALRAESPDIVIVAPCGYGLDGAIEHAAVAAKELPGVEVWAIDGDAVVVRPGPRLVDGVEAMASIVHPNAAPPSHAVRRITPG